MKNSIVYLLFCLSSILTYGQPPETFDLRYVGAEGDNYVTSVKSQMGGTCWAFGSMAAMESNLLITGNWNAQNETGEPDLAEYHLDWWNGYNEYFNQDLEEAYNNGQGLQTHQGGDYRMTTAYISRLEGTVREIDADSYDEPSERYHPNHKKYYPKSVEWYNAGEDLSNLDLIKYKIMEHGVMAVCLSYSNDFMSGVNHYQPSWDNTEPNHSVSIIGWNDNRETQAPGPGAWLVKNSWGENWGMAGYFWISYYDKHACKNPEMGAISFIDVDILDYDTAYYHDYHGWRDTLTNVTEAFNAFEANEDEDVVAVSFFTAGEDVAFQVKIFGQYNNGELVDERLSHTGSIEHSGFHTIDLPDYVTFLTGEKFYVYLELSHGGHPYDRTSFVPVLLGKAATNSKGIVPSTTKEEQSYYRENGEWLDFFHFDEPGDYQGTGSFCIKALAQHNHIMGIQSVDSKEGGFLNFAPNPFTSFASITYEIPEASKVEIEVYSINGQMVEILKSENHMSGAHEISWNNNTLTSGVYFLNMKIDDQFYDQMKIVKVD